MNCKKCLYCDSDLKSINYLFSGDLINLQISQCFKCNAIFRFIRHLDDNDKPNGWSLESTQLTFKRKSAIVIVHLTNTQTFITMSDVPATQIVIPKRLPVTPTNFDSVKLYILFS